MGTPAATTRGFKENEFETVGNLILETLSGLKQNPNDNSKVEKIVKEKVINLCNQFPIYNYVII